MAAVAASSPAVSAAPLWARIWPHIVAILFFGLLAAVYFAPIVFEGQSLAQHDITQFQGGAREVQQWAATHDGHEPLWTNSMFSGMPTYLISAHFSGDWSVYLHRIFTLGLPAVVANLFLALACGYVLLVALGLRPLVAVAGAVALGFSSYNLIILAAGHNTKSLALAYAPLVLGGLLVTFRRDKWLGAALFTLGLAMNIRSNHPQITYYLGLLLVIFGLLELVAAVRAGRLAEFGRRVSLLGLGAAIAVGVSFGRLYTTYEYSKLSNRAKSELSAAPAGAAVAGGANRDRDYAFGWSYGVGESITLLVPNFFGGASQMALSSDSNLAKAGLPTEYLSGMPTYWGAQPSTSGPVYVGAVVCFLFVLGLFVVDKRTRYWLLAGTALSLLLAWGKNFETFNNLVFDLLPGYNKFRAVSMALVMAQLAMPLLAALALSRVLRPAVAPSLPPLPAANPAAAPAPAPHPALAKAIAAAGSGAQFPTPPDAANAQLRPVLWAGAITAGVCALAWLASFSFDFQGAVDAQLTQSGFTPDLLRALRADRAELLRNDVWRALLFIGLALGVLYFHLKGRLAARPAAALVAALVLLDLWGADKRYLGAKNFQPQTIAASFQPSPADEEILKDKDLSYRVLSLKGDPFSDATTSYYHKSIGGYHGAKLRRYQELIERQITPQLQQIFTQNKLDAAPVLNMLNTRYLIIPENAQAKQPEQAARNPGALGNAWFVSQVRAVQSPDQEMAALGTLNPGTEAVVDASKFPAQKAATYDPAGSNIALTDYAPDRLSYRGNAARPGLVVFSEIYYADGWQAYLNGQPVPHIRADYVLRALPVPAGPLSIEFRFEPKAYALGNGVSLASSVVLLLVLLGAGAYWLRRRPAAPQPELAL